MKEHLAAFSAHDVSHLGDWLSERGELYLEVYLPHSAGSGIDYLVHSLTDLRRVIINHAWPALVLTVFRNQYYPLHGRVNDEFISQAQQLIKDGRYYEILDYKRWQDVDKPFPGAGTTLDDGNLHEELRSQLAGLMGQDVAVGTSPFDYEDQRYFIEHPEEALVLTVARDLSFTKNWSRYTPYDQNPEKYRALVDAWNE